MTQPTSQQLAPTLPPTKLKGFDRRRVALIREMESYGWRGRRGTKSHMIMRAPDGTTTASISPKVTSDPRETLNQERPFRAWLRRLEEWADQITGADRALPYAISLPSADSTAVLVALNLLDVAPIRPTRKPVPAPEALAEAPRIEPELAPEPVDTAPEPVEVRLAANSCALCVRDFGTLQALSVHRHRAHSRIACEVCDRPMSPANLGRHMQQHVERMGTHEQVMAEVLRLQGEVSRLRAERNEWQTIAETTETEYVELQQALRALTER